MAKRKPSSKSNSGGSTILSGIVALVVIALFFCLSFMGVDVISLLEEGSEGNNNNSEVGENNPPENNEDDPAENEGGVEPAPSDWYQVYFTDPTCPPEEERTGGIDEIIAADILTAEETVDVAAFEMDSQPIINALIEVRKRGVAVRFATDDEHNPTETTNRLRRNSISVVEDKRSALMHNKIIIIDGRYLWMGAMNFTLNDVYCNNNNTVRWDSPELAANYTLEIDEMVNDREFGPTSSENTETDLTINGIKMENYFSSETKVAPILGELVSQAKDEILFMAFSFTHEDIGEPMLARAEAGVDVRGVFETTGSETEYSYFLPMRDAGLDNLQVRQDGNGRIMHHKVIIIDRKIVVFGSFNFSSNANNSNDENTLIVYDPNLASYFIEEFEIVWGEAKQE